MGRYHARRQSSADINTMETNYYSLLWLLIRFVKNASNLIKMSITETSMNYVCSVKPVMNLVCLSTTVSYVLISVILTPVLIESCATPGTQMQLRCSFLLSLFQRCAHWRSWSSDDAKLSKAAALVNLELTEY